ncbi:YSC84-related protein [Iodobacter arcticus]|uniref:YSC84-related protein n=1 Tax=Iodobacter arcticus TaxID=590593 RepID=A0ABW2QYB5_9NEIS
MRLRSTIFAITTMLAFPVLADSAVKPGNMESSVEQKTPTERRAMIDHATQETLAQVYKQFPNAKSQIAKASAYAVFRTGGFQAMFVGIGGGDGVAIAAGKRTYMDMLQGKLGIGLGAKETREVWVFTSNEAYNKFISSGWSASGEAGAAAKAGKAGVQIAGAKHLAKDVFVYQFTENGLTAEATVNGSKYMVSDELNKK